MANYAKVQVKLPIASEFRMTLFTSWIRQGKIPAGLRSLHRRYCPRGRRAV